MATDSLIAVDIGNTRMKWGLPDGTVRAVPTGAPAWGGPASWAVAGSHAGRVAEFAAWAAGRGDAVTVLDHFGRLPIRVEVDRPEAVGLDRLLNAVAVSARLADGESALVIDAGTAVTVDLVRPGVFAGGAILPGLRALAWSLHEFTAALPLVEVTAAPDFAPGRDTVSAIRLGVYSALVGGVRSAMRAVASDVPARTVVTGGDSRLLMTAIDGEYDDALTLRGIRAAAEAS